MRKGLDEAEEDDDEEDNDKDVAVCQRGVHYLPKIISIGGVYDNVREHLRMNHLGSLAHVCTLYDLHPLACPFWGMILFVSKARHI